MSGATEPTFDPAKVLRHYSQPAEAGAVLIRPNGTDLGTYVRGADFDAATAEIARLRSAVGQAESERDEAREHLSEIAGRFHRRADRASATADDLPDGSQAHSYAQGQADAYADAGGIAANPGRE